MPLWTTRRSAPFSTICAGISPFSEEELDDCLAFLCWASTFDAADVTGIGTWDAATSAAHFLTDDLAGVAAQLQPCCAAP